MCGCAERVASHGFATASGSAGYAGGAAATFWEGVAASLLVRGVLYANAHPAPRTWLPLRRSAWAAAQHGAAANAAQLQSLVWAGGGAALHWCAHAQKQPNLLERNGTCPAAPCYACAPWSNSAWVEIERVGGCQSCLLMLQMTCMESP